jgi:DNA invertase Pin-like site-specific DNA recombinase
MRVALYIRVSTHEQNSSLQRQEMEQYVTAHGWTIAETYDDVMSGAKSGRPGLLRLLNDAAARQFDCVCVWKLDRFGRSLRDCLNNIETLGRHNVRFISVTQKLDTDKADPASRFLLHILGAAAEFERSLIKDRVNAGIKAARKAGTTLGRPKLVFNRDEVHALRAQGLSLREIAAKLNLGRGTVVRVLEQVDEAA